MSKILLTGFGPYPGVKINLSQKLMNIMDTVADGLVGYWATVPLKDMYEALKQAGIPVRISNHAGTYLCNHLMYYSL